MTAVELGLRLCATHITATRRRGMRPGRAGWRCLRAVQFAKGCSPPSEAITAGPRVLQSITQSVCRRQLAAPKRAEVPAGNQVAAEQVTKREHDVHVLGLGLTRTGAGNQKSEG